MWPTQPATRPANAEPAERRYAGTPPQQVSVAVHGPGGTVADAAGSVERTLELLKADRGVSICFFRGRARIAGSVGIIELERETGLEPATLCLGNKRATVGPKGNARFFKGLRGLEAELERLKMYPVGPVE